MMTVPYPRYHHGSRSPYRLHAPTPPDVDPTPTPPKPEIDPDAQPPEYDPDTSQPIIPPDSDPPANIPPTAASRACAGRQPSSACTR